MDKYTRQSVERQEFDYFSTIYALMMSLFIMVLIVIGQNSTAICQSMDFKTHSQIPPSRFPDVSDVRHSRVASYPDLVGGQVFITMADSLPGSISSPNEMYATDSPNSIQMYRLTVFEKQMHLVFSHEKDLYLRNPNHLPEFFNDLRNANSKPKENLNPYQKKAKPFQPIIHSTALRYEVEPAIIQAIIMAESSFNPNAVSYRGAQGLMQLMPRTARYLGVEDSFNPQHNIEGGVKYFKRLLNRFNGDVTLALAAYNAGSRNVHKYKGVPPFSETKSYIEKVLKYYAAYKTT